MIFIRLKKKHGLFILKNDNKKKAIMDMAKVYIKGIKWKIKKNLSLLFYHFQELTIVNCFLHVFRICVWGACVREILYPLLR